MNTSGNTILITGGASGIGLELAKKLIAEGNTVIVCGRDEERLDAARAAVSGLVTIRADIADAASRLALTTEVTTRFPALNILINDAGIVNVSNIADPDFIEILEAETATNFVGPTALVSLLLPVLKVQPQAIVANITIGYVFVTGARTPQYSATKSALHSITRSLRFQLRGTRIRVLEIMPPPVDTNMASHYNGPKAAVEPIAHQFMRALFGARNEVAIGVSRMAAIASRLAPKIAFALVNYSEARAEAKESRAGA